MGWGRGLLPCGFEKRVRKAESAAARAADTTAARRDLGWLPRVGIVDGLAAELSWVERAYAGSGLARALDDMVTEQAS